ncbi:MAG: N-acetylmuramoyl-L-alanine amidase [Clostridia bacterium]|nr:N-acetylmuramoyl-L-alanine amidase [Clostridia bacterium]
MSRKIYISPSNQVGNTYATGNTNEKEQCHKIAKACVDALVENGFQVMCTYNDDMYKRVEESNAFGADIHIAIHTNATAKHNVTGGSQVLLYSISGEREKAGNAVLSRLSPITPGKSAERLVLKPDFYEVRATKGMALYCECEFHDTQLGSDFIINNTDRIGEAIAYGICDYYGIVPKNKNSAPNDGTLYKVQVGAFSVRENAENYLAKLKNAGFEGFIVS